MALSFKPLWAFALVAALSLPTMVLGAMSSAAPLLLPTTGAALVTIYGTCSSTPANPCKVRLAGTHQAFASWISTTSVRAKSSPGNARTVAAVLSCPGCAGSMLTNAFSYATTAIELIVAVSGSTGIAVSTSTDAAGSTGYPSRGGQVTSVSMTIAAADRVPLAGGKSVTVSFTTATALASGQTVTLTYPNGYFTGAPTTPVTASSGFAASIAAMGATTVIMTATANVAAGAYTVTVSGVTMGSIIITSGSNSPITGSVAITFSGVGFGSVNVCSRARMLMSAASWTGWRSDSSVVARSNRLSAFSSATSSLVLTVQQRSGSFSAALSYNSPLILGPCYIGIHASVCFNYANTANPLFPPATGASSITVRGIGFASHWLSSTSRIFSSASATTAWISDSGIKIRCSFGVGYRSTVVLSGVMQTCSMSAAVSYSVALVHSLSPQNNPMTGGVSMSIQGSNFGASNFSPRLFFIWSAPPASFWSSFSSLICRSNGANYGHLHSTAHAVYVSVGLQSKRVTNIFSFDFPVYSSTVSGNHPATGSSSLTIVGLGFGATSWLGLKFRLASSAAPGSSSWRSDSVVWGRVGAGSGIQGAVVGTYANGKALVRLTSSFSYDVVVLRNVSANAPATGGASMLVTFTGRSFGTCNMCNRVRVLKSAASASVWRSESSLVARSVAGTGRNLDVVVSAAVWSVQFTNSVTYDAAVLDSAAIAILPSSGSFRTVAIGQGFGISSQSSLLSFSGTGAAASAWRSSSAVAAKVCAGAGQQLVVALSLVMSCSNCAAGQSFPVLFSRFASFSSPTVSSLRISSAGTSGTVVRVFGARLCVFDASAAARVTRTAVRSSMWMSDSMLAAKAGSSLMPANSVVVSAGSLSADSFTFIAIPELSASVSQSAPTTGAWLLKSFSTINMGSNVFSVRLRFGVSACASSVRP
jgi:hypothetical protein